MKQIITFYILFFLCILTVPVSLFAETYPEVLFENSILPGSYSESKVQYEGNSWIRNYRKNLPVSDSIFFTPNNALSLNYISSAHGYWQADVFYREGYQTDRGSVLLLKLYVQPGTTIDELPAFQIIQADSVKSETLLFKDYIKGFKDKVWLSVEVPIGKIQGVSDNPQIRAIRFFQNAFDGREHQLFIDQIEILPSTTPSNKLTSAAVIQSAVPFEKHIEIFWRLPLTPSIRYIKIYRSEDNKDFKAVAIRPIFATKYSDIVSEVGKTYYYKIAWLDYQYRESPFSIVKEAKTRLLTSQELLDMIQQANIQYFVDGSEFNSGMQEFRRSRNDAIVSSKLSGIGIMAMISGVNQKMIPRSVLIDRLGKITEFLSSAESIHGAFPALLNGRTGKGVFSNPANPVIDLDGTSYLMQGLLVAKQYLNQKDASESALRSKITAIVNGVEWNQFMMPKSPFLFTNWSVDTNFEGAMPLQGRKALSTYLMAWASPAYNIPLSDSISIARDTSEEVYYGLPLKAGNIDDSLTELLTAFAVFDPRDKYDKVANYYHELQNLILIQYRKSLEDGSLPVAIGSNLIVDSLGIVNPSTLVSTYAFHPDFALRNLEEVYRDYPSLFWTDYGFRTVNIKENRLLQDIQGIDFGIEAIMIENGKTNLIWNLFTRDEDITRIVNALFSSETNSSN